MASCTCWGMITPRTARPNAWKPWNATCCRVSASPTPMRWETMSNIPDDGEASAPDGRRGLIQALAARFGFGGERQRGRDAEEEDMSQAAAHLIDPAQAFHHPTVPRGMPPR